MVRESIMIVMVFQNLSIKEGAFIHVVAFYILERGVQGFSYETATCRLDIHLQGLLQNQEVFVFGGLPNRER